MFEAVGLLGPPAPVGLSKITYRISSIKSPPPAPLIKYWNCEVRCLCLLEDGAN